jgi:hypothetical protein
MSALRAEREIDLIISFDFSAGNPMEVRSPYLRNIQIPGKKIAEGMEKIKQTCLLKFSTCKKL